MRFEKQDLRLLAISHLRLLAFTCVHLRLLAFTCVHLRFPTTYRGLPSRRSPLRFTPCPLPSALCPLPSALCSLTFALPPQMQAFGGISATLRPALCPLLLAPCPLSFTFSFHHSYIPIHHLLLPIPESDHHPVHIHPGIQCDTLPRAVPCM